MGKLKYFQSVSIALLMAALTMLVQFTPYPAYASIEAVQFDEPELLKRYQGLIAELRCLVCQNQNLADSDADLAKDLRRKTEEMLKEGLSDQQILDYMRERYGDFVLYRPPVNSATSFLWFGPIILLVLAVIGVFLTIKQKQKAAAGLNSTATQADESDEKLMQVRELLNNVPDQQSKQ